MKHYYCTGECGGVSDTPGTCQAESCSMHNKPLVACDCDTPEIHKHTRFLDDVEDMETSE